MATTYYMSPITMIVQYFTNLGIIAPGALIYTYVGGTVNTPLSTYTDSTGTVLNANPLVASGAGRPQSPSGAPVGFWVPTPGRVKLVVTDAAGNLLIGPIDNIPAVLGPDDTSALQALLASPTSTNLTGVGPVAGADLVANAVKSYATFSDVRAANQPAPASGQTLIVQVEGGTAVGDGLGGSFYWAASSTATDDSRNVLKPSVTSGAGRYLRLIGLGQSFSLVKTTDQSNATTNLLNGVVSELAIPVLAGATYLVQYRLLLQGAGAGANGWKVRGDIALGTTINAGSGILVGAGNVTTEVVAIAANNTKALVSVAVSDTFNADLIVKPSSLDFLQLSFAQNSSTADAITLKTGSLLAVTRIA
jgi:hypothetical protein